MPVSTRGRTRQLLKAVKVTINLNYGFKTADLASLPGLSSADLVALGQQDLTRGLGLVALSPRAPKPAQYAKKLIGGSQSSVSTFGDGTTSAAMSKAAGAGWQLRKAVSTLSLGETSKTKEVVVPLTNNLYIAYPVPVIDVTGDNAALLGWIQKVGAITLSKTVRSPTSIKVPLVKKPSGRSSITLPCAPSKVANALANGWKLARPESGQARLL